MRRIRFGENRDRDSIVNRIRFRVGLVENIVIIESNSGGFRRIIFRLERLGIRIYVSIIIVFFRRIFENEFVELLLVVFRLILR